MTNLKTGLVLAGGGARGAYEVGVLSYLREELQPELGRELRVDILAGTSVGAILACYLAATSHETRTQARRLAEHWRAMKVEEVLRFGVGDLFRLMRESLGRPSTEGDIQAGGLVDPTWLRRLVGHGIPWLEIGRNLRRGNLEALAVSTTHVGSGHTTVFVQRRGGGAPPWGKDPSHRVVPTRIGPNHALASAAIPVVFPAVRIRKQLHVDGGLKLNVPISPALRLGAQRVAVISLRSEPSLLQQPPPQQQHEQEQAYVTVPFLLGKVLNSFLADRTDQDLDRLRRLNAILEAGTQAYGPEFAHTLSGVLMPHRNRPVRYVRELLVRPSLDLGALAAEYVRAPAFRKRSNGLAHRAILRLVDREAAHEADLASYLLFDGDFAEQLMELGRKDARAQREQWLRFWSEEPQSVAEGLPSATPSAA